MKVVMAEPGQYARAAEIGDGLESLQKAVGGLIDCAYPWREKVCIVCNDEGLINGMPMNDTARWPVRFSSAGSAGKTFAA